jgi:hypothetical protein
MVTDGLALTVIVILAVAEQLFASVPVTVYVVFEEGVTTFGFPVPSPLLQE